MDPGKSMLMGHSPVLAVPEADMGPWATRKNLGSSRPRTAFLAKAGVLSG